MFISFVKEIYNKIKNKNLNIYASRAIYECDECKKQYESCVFNREQVFKKYNKDLCASCRLKTQYKIGMRNSQIEHCKTLAHNQKGKTYEEMFGEEKAKNIKLKLSEKFSGKNNPMYGRNDQSHGLIEKAKRLKGKTYEEIYGKEKAQKIKNTLSKEFSNENNPMYGKPSPQGSGNGWSGWYKDKYFRSLLELSYMIYLDKNNIEWITAESEDFAVKYKNYKNEYCNYFPDFFLPKTNEVIEIKPKRLCTSKSNKLKFENARKKFKNFIIITENDIDKISLNELQELLKNKTVKLLEKYNNKLKEYIENEKNK